MADLVERPKLELNVLLSLSEHEVGALDALAGYGTDAFLEVFYAKMGKAYLEPHEAGLRSLFESVRSQLGGIRDRMHAARKVFNGKAGDAP